MSVISEAINEQASIAMPGMGAVRSYAVEPRLETALLEEKLRAGMALSGACVVAIIAYFGLYGVLTNSVNTRRKEMALHLCFGASAWDLRRSVLRQAAICFVSGAVISLASARVIEQVSSGLFLATGMWSWAVAIVVIFFCLLASILIAIMPANAAARVSPTGILKEQ